MVNRTSKTEGEALFSTEDAAEILLLKPNTLKMWRSQGKGPKYVRLASSRAAYRLEDLRQFVEGHVVQPGQAEVQV